MNNLYRDYNLVTVKIIAAGKEYLVSTINTGSQSINDTNSGPHLESIEIESPSVGGQAGSVNQMGIGATGTVTVKDYKDKIFTVLSNHLTNYKDTDLGPYPRIQIEIKCWAGSLSFYGFIQNWNFSYSGLSPSIVITWGQYQNTPTALPTEHPLITSGSTWNSPGDLLRAIRSDFPNSPDCNAINIIVKTNDGKVYKNDEINQILKFPNDKITLDFNSVEKISGNNQLNILNFLAKESVHINTNKAFIKYINSDSRGSTLVLEEPIDNNGKERQLENVDLDEIVFILNGHFPAYSKHEFKSLGNKYVVPIQTFKFSIDYNNLCLATGIIPNPNGNITSGNSGMTTTNGSATTTAAQINGQTQPVNNLEMSFDCYNVALFSANDLNKPIHLLIYNEYGELHPISKAEKRAMVTKFQYSLQDAVISASITCTTVYNNIVSKVTPDSNGTVKTETVIK